MSGSRTFTKGDQAEAAIRNLLAGGEFSPGERISLRKLAGVLGVSVMPVRNAVARLQSDGALEVEPGKAVRVPTMNADQFRELLDVRIEIEGHAAALAAAHRTDEDLNRIEQLATSFQMLGVGQATRSSGTARVNMELHFAIYRAAKSPLLVEIIERLWLKAGPVIYYHIYLDKIASPTRDSVIFHGQAVDAIRNRDATKARNAIAQDLRLTGRRILSEDAFLRDPIANKNP